MYLALIVACTLGLGLPAALLSATILNLIALRDLVRQTLKAKVDGFVDRRRFMPAVCGKVYVPSASIARPEDAWQQGMAEPLTDGSWRAVVAALRAEEAEAA